VIGKKENKPKSHELKNKQIEKLILALQ